MLKSKILSFIAAALILASCEGGTPVTSEEVIDAALKAARAYVTFVSKKYAAVPAIQNIANEALDNFANDKRAEYIQALKENCNQEELKILKQRYSCFGDAPDEATANKCVETHKLQVGNCEVKSFELFKKTKEAVMDAVIAVLRPR